MNSYWIFSRKPPPGLLFFISLFVINIVNGQSREVHFIEIFGNRQVSQDLLRPRLPLREDESIAEGLTKDSVEALMKQVTGVKYATAEFICCDDKGGPMLFIGIGENDSVLIRWNPTPTENIRLPENMTADYEEFIDLLPEAIQHGQGQEDYSQGHSMIAYPPARAVQERFKADAKYELLLRRILSKASEANQRAAAAQIIAYAVDKRTVIDDLVKAASDPDEEVRNNAMRALGVIATFGLQHPELEINIPAKPFIRMLNSIVWFDRNKGSNLLLSLTTSRDPALMQQLKEQCLPSLTEMARWRSRGHAFSSYVILSRLAGRQDEDIFKEFQNEKYSVSVDELLRMIH